MTEFNSKIKTIEWIKDLNVSRMVDQTLLPYEYKLVDIKTSNQMYDAIKTMIVRGAPAIGVAGAEGVCLKALELKHQKVDFATFKAELLLGCDYIESSRPTAVNLHFCIEKQKEVIKKYFSVDEITDKLIENAIKLENEDIEINKKIGYYGAEIVPFGAKILTHCNAGALATVGYGTALGVVRSAFERDKTIQVFADETRPRGQGARITTFELTMDNIPVALLTDGMCAYFMSKKMIDLVVVGADRIAANGDTANKIGTYTVAICAKHFGIPFYVAAPKSTIDFSISDGSQIPIELRGEEEVTIVNGKRICADNVKVINPSFDVTENGLITGIITQFGVFAPSELEKIKNLY